MISNRAFAIAVCVFLGIVWSYKMLVPARERLSDESVRLLEMNHCLAYSDTVLRIRFLDYQTYFDTLIDRKSMPILHFAGFGMGSGDRYSTNEKPSPCTFYQRSLHKASSPLDIAANAYVQAYDKMRPEARAIEQLYARRSPEVPQALQFHQAIEKAMEELQARAIPFNQALESPMLTLRASQLEQIEERLGRDQHWYTLNFMLMARQGIDQLTELAGNKRLTPDQVQALHHSLLAAWNDAEGYFKSLPRLTSAEGGKPVWSGIREPAKAWIDTLATLQQHWTAQAEPIQLSSDFEVMGQGYDRMWMRYNLAVQNQY